LASAQQSDAAVLQSNQNELLNSDLQQSAAAARKTLTDILQQMTRVWRENSYQLSFVQILPSQVNSYQYQHVFADQRHYAQLSALDG
ncbi:sigma-E factor regulatory protein RseB domain-containing protein, partial [Chryseobacterium gambrini]|uniref:sigma-E factor regulatory protein RseB domain-containing protein n=1 Tax=Chryseobacterium gambrini TaxID=373672 RepID=UPI0025B2AA97